MSRGPSAQAGAAKIRIRQLPQQDGNVGQFVTSSKDSNARYGKVGTVPLQRPDARDEMQYQRSLRWGRLMTSIRPRTMLVCAIRELSEGMSWIEKSNLGNASQGRKWETMARLVTQRESLPKPRSFNDKLLYLDIAAEIHHKAAPRQTQNCCWLPSATSATDHSLHLSSLCADHRNSRECAGSVKASTKNYCLFPQRTPA